MKKYSKITVLTPNDFTNEPVVLTEKEIKTFDNTIKTLLARYIHFFEFGLRFFNVRIARDTKKNKINLFTESLDLITSYVFEYPKTKTQILETNILFSMDQISFDFETSDGKMTVVANSGGINNQNNCYSFKLEKEGVTKLLELTVFKNELHAVKAAIYGQEDYREKIFNIVDFKNYSALVYDLNNYNLPCIGEDDKEGGSRHASFSFSYNSPLSCSVDTYYCENYGNRHKAPKTASISSHYHDYQNIGISPEDALDKLTASYNEFPVIFSHPRCRETINYVEEDFNNQFPYLISYVAARLGLYKLSKLDEYPGNEKYDNVEFLPECDFQEKENTK